MAEVKTKITKASPEAFLKTVKDTEKREDSLELLKLFKKVTGEKPVMWGTAIIGFGQFHYKSERSSREGEWMLTGFSPRAANLTIYIMPGFKEYGAILKKLGKFKISTGSCLNVKRLSDIDTQVLSALIQRSVSDMRKKYKIPAK